MLKSHIFDKFHTKYEFSCFYKFVRIKGKEGQIKSSATILTTMAEVHTPLVLWAQRSDKVFVSVQLADVTEEKINLQVHLLLFVLCIQY